METDLNHPSQTEPIKILIAGDLAPLGRPEALLSYGKAALVWEGVKPVLDAHDLNIANLECPLTSAHTSITKYGGHLRAAPECAAGIRLGGFQALTLANNHIMDMGEAGLQESLEVCHSAGLQTVGAGKNLEEAVQPLIVPVKGTRVVILSFAEHEFSIASPRRGGAWPLDLIDNYRQIAEARRQADILLVIIHGGNEGYPLPSPRLVKTCHFFAEIGANAVICLHSHTASGMEMYQGVPIIYGIGNFLFDVPGQPTSWYQGMLVSLQVENGSVSGVELIPYWQCRSLPAVQRMEGQDAADFQTEMNRLCAIIQDPRALAEAWQNYCQTQQGWYLARLAATNRLAENLWSRRLIPPALIRKRVPNWLGLVRTQAHREVLIEVLEQLSGD